MSIHVLNELKPKRVLDGFGASGIRGIRFSLETDSETHISEINPVSLKIISENVDRNRASVTIHHDSFAEVARKILFDYIDVDPYGSTLPYLDAAINNVKPNGYIGITATDLTTLTASLPKKTLRRYGATLVNGPHRHEKGIRLLIAECARRAASFDRAIVPLLSVWGGHYYRIFLKVQAGAAKADSMLKEIGTVNLRTIFGKAYPDLEEGRIWKGKLSDPDLTGRVSGEIGKNPEHSAMSTCLANEDLNILFLELTDLAKFARSDLPRISRVINRISEKGFRAGRTHFSPTGVKTDMEYSEAFDLVLQTLKRQNE